MPLLKQQELVAELDKGRTAPLYLLFGEETFLIDETLRRIESFTVDPSTRDFNLCRFEGRETTAAALMDALNSYPFLGEKKLVVVRDFDALPAAAMEQVESYLANPSPFTVFVAVANKVDRRKKIFLAFENKGVSTQFFPLFESQVPFWIDRRVKGKGYSIDREAVNLLIETVGSDLGRLDAAIVQLCTYAGDKKNLLPAHVEAVVGDVREWSVFELANAVGERDWEKGLKILGKMFQEGEEPVMIVAMLARHFRILARGMGMMGKGMPKESVAGSLRVPKSAWPSLFQQFRVMREEDAEKALLTLGRVDRALKSGGGHPRLILETFILETSGMLPRSRHS